MPRLVVCSFINSVLERYMCYMTHFPDHNECEDDPCHINATCTNTIGSFNCTCKVGFSGSGFECEGMLILICRW